MSSVSLLLLPPRPPPPDKPDTCASTTSSVLSRYFGRRLVALVPGSPCSGNRGYCDKFKLCRLLYADGPIARLKNSFLNLDDFDDVAEWMKVYFLHFIPFLFCLLSRHAIKEQVGVGQLPQGCLERSYPTLRFKYQNPFRLEVLEYCTSIQMF